MYDLQYYKAKTVDDAAAKINQAKDGKYIAGGQTLIPTMKARLASPSDLIDISQIDSMTGIKITDSEIIINASTTHDEVANSLEVQRVIPVLSDLAGNIGDPAVRARGTIGGSVANNDPAADYPAICLGLDATIITNLREINAMVGVFIGILENGARVSITGAGNTGVFRSLDMEKALEKDFSVAAISNIKVPLVEIMSDLHGSAEYRAHLIGVMAKRAVMSC
jgi:carbon-monoxide dehydrogenase medium subunit